MTKLLPPPYEAYVRMSDFIALQRELTEFKELTAQRQKLYEQFWKERLTWIGLIVTSWGIAVAALLHII